MRETHHPPAIGALHALYPDLAAANWRFR